MPRCHMPLTPLAAMYEHEPELGHVATDFAPVLRRLLTATLAVSCASAGKSRSRSPPSMTSAARPTWHGTTIDGRGWARTSDLSRVR
jgi:hypothetical protein